MSFSINTNVSSLQAQNYLRINSDFQGKTINRVTSGLRIVQSGDDAAGLAIANGYRSDQAVLTQGIQNANNGLSQLQIMDGGINNISMLLDRARTLATQSASGTFTGDRSVLDSEYQSVLGEIDRQAQSIGLNQGGTFARTLSVFIGGGKGANNSAVISNGSVSVDLSKSTVDTQGLGLKGFTAGWQNVTDSGLYDLSSGNVNTSVSKVLADGTNAGVVTGAGGFVKFSLSGPGFSSGAGAAVTINANMANVADTATLVSAINAGIQAATQAGTPQGDALKAANIVAQIHTGTDGHQQLQFVSSNSAFQVTAGDIVANAFLGNFTTNTAGDASASAGTGLAVGHLASFMSGGTQQISGAVGANGQTAGLVYTTMTHSNVATANQTQTLTFSINDATGTPQNQAVTLDGMSGVLAATADLTAALAVQEINTALQSNGNAAVRSIVATVDGTNGKILFSSNSSTPFNVSIGAASTSTTIGNVGLVGANTIAQSASVGIGATSSIGTQTGAQSAVSALAASVASLGKSQAVVGKGENQFNYAVNLAQSQLVNLGTAESRIRDADLAAEAANLTKAQILMQAGVAALAQANSAPQQVLALLKG